MYSVNGLKGKLSSKRIQTIEMKRSRPLKRGSKRHGVMKLALGSRNRFSASLLGSHLISEL